MNTSAPAARVARALDVFGCALDGVALVEASAGTGKTWNLCGLYLRLLLEKRLDVQQVLVVTFTNAATAELRERIRARLVDLAAGLAGQPAALADGFVAPLLSALRGAGLADDEMRERVGRALQTFDEAAIHTIHGFCQRALADAPFASAMPMRLEIADDAAARREVVHDFWRRRVAGDALPPALAALLLSQGDTPERWDELVRRRAAKPLARLVWPAALDAPAQAVDTAALDAAFAAARALWRAERRQILAIVDEALPGLHQGSYKPEAVAAAAQCWDRVAAAPSALLAPGASRLKKDRPALLGAATLKPKKKFPPPRPHPFFAAADAFLEALAATRAALGVERLRLLRDLLAEAPERLRELKRERRAIAFDDMLQNLHERLTGGQCPQLAAALRTRFPAALIDEFQDTDPLQWAIFDRVWGAGADGDAGPLFLIGDPKQAIYSFRNADLHTYLAARDTADAHWTLAQNQRSSEAVLGALNALFANNPRAFMLDGLGYLPVGYGSKQRAPFADAGGVERAALEVWQLPEDGGPLKKSGAQQAAARACAAEIARLITAGRNGAATLAGRALAAGDIAVLVRSHRQGGLMRAELAALGVGSVELSQASVFASPDAEDLERVLAAVLEPAHAPRLRAALATEAMGRDARAIAALADDEAALGALVERFAGYRETWRQRGVAVMLRRWMRDEDVVARLLARADGERRMTNWLHLAECLQRAADARGATPDALLRWLHEQRAAPDRDEAAQLRLESDRNLVQIVTIHKSKGLEYPVVFCPFAFDGGLGPRAAGEGRELHDEDGRQLWVFDADAVDDAAKSRAKVEQAAEGLRLLYVALTRAVHRLVLVVGPYVCQKSTAESSRALVNWLVAGAGRAPADWVEAKIAPDEIAAAWRAFARAQAPRVALRPLPDVPGVRVAPAAADADAIAALPPPAAIAPPWWIGSYSSLTHGLRHEAAAADRDERQRAVRGAAPAALATDDVLRFPRGAAAGECLHALFEHADFAAPPSWPGAAAQALKAQPPEPGADAAALAPMLVTLLGDVLATPLPGGVVLGAVARGRRIAELEFSLPAPVLRADALAAALRDAGLPAPTLAFGTLHGYLRGFVDLVFEHEGRVHLLDWKSNHLGWTPAAYAADAVEREVFANGYQLQALLYLVALHRWLRARRAGYDPARHLGGAMVLFVRGVRPDWRAADGTPTGVWSLTPPLAVIERVSALFDEETPR